MKRWFAVGLPCCISAVPGSCGLEFQRSSFHCCVLEVRAFYSRNKGRAKSIEVRNLRGAGGSTALQNKLIFEVYSVKHSEDSFAIKILLRHGS